MGSPPQDECSHGVNPVRSPVEHRFLGVRCKLSNGFSRDVLTDRGLDLTLHGLFFLLLCSLQGSTLRFFLVLLAQWSHSDPIPNSVVKRCHGHDTCLVTGWDNSSVPGLSSNTKPPSTPLHSVAGLCFFVCFLDKPPRRQECH